MEISPYFLPLAGGVLLNIGTSAFLSHAGRILGVSGIIDGAIFDHTGWKVASLLGMVAAPAINKLFGLYEVVPSRAVDVAGVAGLFVATAGFLVGLGSRLGSGCTSGHFLCGVSRLSPRSLVATLIFFPTAVIVGNIFSPVAISRATPPVLPSLDVSSASIIVGSILTSAFLLRRLLPRIGKTSDSYITAFLTSYTFATGLILSGMDKSSVVLGFFRIPPFTSDFSQWDPSLLFLAVTALGGNAFHWFKRASKQKKGKLQGAGWHVPTRRDVDARLVLGSLAFGVGWGMMGVCPGPYLVNIGEALVGLRAGWSQLAVFGGSVVAGMAVARKI